MIQDYDENLEKIVRTVVPKWNELRARKSDFARLDENTFKSLSFMFVGEPSLLCFTDSKDLATPRIEYFPICIQRADAKTYNFEQVTLARLGGRSQFEQQVRWLFEKPSMRLLESEEEVADGMESDAQRYALRFYSGLELADPNGHGRLQITASNLPDLVSYAKFMF
jgi:hypothetical protein